jgi:transposase-like protein
MGKSITDSGLAARAERRGYLEEQLRCKTREWIERMVNEELEMALGVGWYERSDTRRGYRKGVRERSFTTRTGKHEIAMPRGAYFEPGADGKKEWNSELIGRYVRRSDEVEEGLLKSYLCGTNTRRIAHALGPLLEGAALSKSTVSRIVSCLEEQFEQWRNRELSGEDIGILFLDGFTLKFRWGGKVERVPVLSAIGVRTDGTRVLLMLEVRTSESEGAWQSVTESLAGRGVKAPVLAVIDGNKGLYKAVKGSWPWIEVQRCTKHKLENLATHAPKRRYDQIKADYHAIIYADDEERARRAYARFEQKWRKDCPQVVKSLQESGEELLTFYRYPKSMWKMLRTTNCSERLNEEFRRRVKTQGSFPNADAGLKLLYGMCAAGVVLLRRIHGWKELPDVVYARRVKHGLIKSLDIAA